MIANSQHFMSIGHYTWETHSCRVRDCNPTQEHFWHQHCPRQPEEQQ